MKDHRWIDKRSLAFGRVIVEQLATHPQHIALARANVARWMQSCSPHSRPTLLEWSQALDGPMEGVIALLIGNDERSTRLRQSNPFAGLLSNEKRNAILRQFEAYDKAST